MKTRGTTEDVETKSKIDRQRYSVVRKFFIRSFLHLIFWDIILNRLVLRWLRKNPAQRWQKISRSYRDLAIEMGGVLIKLGQVHPARLAKNHTEFPAGCDRHLKNMLLESPPATLYVSYSRMCRRGHCFQELI